MLPPLVLAITTALILFNKVGSPQFVGWLAVPIVFGLVAARISGVPSFLVPSLLGLGIAALTQFFYPYLYGQLLSLQVDMLVALTARNLLYIPLLVWAVWALCHPLVEQRRSRIRVSLGPGRVRLALLALALGGFGIGTTEFVAMGLLPNIARGPAPRPLDASPPRRPSPRPAR